jgi:hypothetical protein
MMAAITACIDNLYGTVDVTTAVMCGVRHVADDSDDVALDVDAVASGQRGCRAEGP